jgi:hypothetical protein
MLKVSDLKANIYYLSPEAKPNRTGAERDTYEDGTDAIHDYNDAVTGAILIDTARIRAAQLEKLVSDHLHDIAFLKAAEGRTREMAVRQAMKCIPPDIQATVHGSEAIHLCDNALEAYQKAITPVPPPLHKSEMPVEPSTSQNTNPRVASIRLVPFQVRDVADARLFRGDQVTLQPGSRGQEQLSPSGEVTVVRPAQDRIIHVGTKRSTHSTYPEPIPFAVVDQDGRRPRPSMTKVIRSGQAGEKEITVEWAVFHDGKRHERTRTRVLRGPVPQIVGTGPKPPPAPMVMCSECRTRYPKSMKQCPECGVAQIP